MLIKSGDHDDQSHSKEMKALEGQDQDELGSKEIFELVESKVKAHFSTRRETDLAEMMQKLRYLQASNDQLEARADSLLRKVAEVTLLPQKLDKKASTAALKCKANDELKIKLRERVGELKEETKVRDEQVQELENRLTSAKEHIEQLANERTALIAKIEAGEGVETAINQMKQEKEQLRERVTALEGTLQSLTDESTKAVDELYKQLTEVKVQLETSDMKCDKLQTRVSKKKEKLAAKSLKIQKLKTSLTAKELKDVHKLLSERDFELRQLKKEREEEQASLATFLQSEKKKWIQLTKKCHDIQQQVSKSRICVENRALRASATSLHYNSQEKHKKAGWTRYVPEEGKHIVIMDTLPSSGMGYHYMFSDDGEEKRRVLRRGPKITIARDSLRPDHPSNVYEDVEEDDDVDEDVDEEVDEQVQEDVEEERLNTHIFDDDNQPLNTHIIFDDDDQPLNTHIIFDDDDQPLNTHIIFDDDDQPLNTHILFDDDVQPLNTHIIFDDDDLPEEDSFPWPPRTSSRREKLKMARMASRALREEREPRVSDVSG